MATRNRKVVLAPGLGWYYLAPKPEEHRSDPPPAGVALKRGTFEDGDALHEASGTVALLRVGERHVLRFEGYEATAGPDVYVYLTPKARAGSVEEVERQGVQVRTPTLMGQATWRGDFNLDVPEGVDPSTFGGVSIWCDTYNVLFGHAELGDLPDA